MNQLWVHLCVRVEKSKNGGESSVAVSFIMREMLSAILLLSVLIQVEFIPGGELIMSEQKNQASKQPTLDFLHAPVVQLKANALPVTLSRTGYESSVADVVVTKWSTAQ